MKTTDKQLNKNNNAKESLNENSTGPQLKHLRVKSCI
jgi:hypothetical protein